MTRLPDPIRTVLDARTSESEVAAVFRRVTRRRAERRRPRRLVPALAFAAAVVALAAFVFFRGGVPAPGEGPGPLAEVGGDAPRTLSGGAPIDRTARLSDGSRVVVRAGARLSVLENSGRTFVTHLAGGRAEFSVKPGGPRRWQIECGIATIEVVGTEFVLARSTDALDVEVRHGVVLVRGEHVPERVQRLTAGAVLHVTAPEPKGSGLETAPPASASAALPELPVVGALAAPPSAPATAPLAPSAEPQAPGPGSFYDDADRARRAGRARDAARLLEEALAAEPRGHRAALGSFTLGVLYLEELGSPASAARAFERTLAAGAPASLEEDARARLVEARAAMGDSSGARRAADEYRSRFPEGRRLRDVARFDPK